MKIKEKIVVGLILVLVCALFANVFLLGNLFFKGTGKVEQIYASVKIADENILQRFMLSLNNNEMPKFTIQKEYFLNHIDGKPVVLRIVKMECCGTTEAFVTGDGKNIYIGYLNEVEYKSPLATTSQMIPQITMRTVVHELVHLSTLHFGNVTECQFTSSKVCQELYAYNAENLYMQILSLDEDNYFRIQK